MKKIALITSITLITLSHRSQAQTYSGQFKKETTLHYKGADLSSQTVKYKSGEVTIQPNTLSINGEAYTILKHEAPELQDEGYWAQLLTIVTKGKTGIYKVMDCIIGLKPDKKTVNYVQLNKTKSTKVGYELVN